MIEIAQASLQVQGRKLLDGFSLRLPDPGIYLLLGANGSGKSIICNLLVGKLKPQRGTVRIDGEPLYRWLGGYARPVLYYRSGVGLGSDVRLEEHLDSELRLVGGASALFRPLWPVLEETLGLPRTIPVTALSQGQANLVQVALAAAAPVQLAILDGQLDALDPASLQDAANLLRQTAIVEDKYILLTATRYSMALPGIREVLRLAGGIPVTLNKPAASGAEQVGPAVPANTVKLILRDWSPNARAVSSSSAITILEKLPDGLRVRLTGRLDEALAELGAQGLTVTRIEWE